MDLYIFTGLIVCGGLAYYEAYILEGKDAGTFTKTGSKIIPRTGCRSHRNLHCAYRYRLGQDRDQRSCPFEYRAERTGVENRVSG